jgi:hypothetical protein
MVLATATAVTGLAAARLPIGFWDKNTALAYVAIGALVLLAIREPISSWRRELRAGLRQDVLDVLRGAMLRIVEVSGLDWRTLGVHVFLVQHRARRFWRPELVRFARWRLARQTASGPIIWRKGKGVIGRCWEEARDVGANLAEEWAPHVGCTQVAWEALPAELRYGFSFEEFNSSPLAQGAIVATPMLDQEGRVMGCVSADTPREGYDQLWRAPVREILQEAAETISALLGH